MPITFRGRRPEGVGSSRPIIAAPRPATATPPSANQSVMDASARASGVSTRAPFRVVTPTPAPVPRKPYR